MPEIRVLSKEVSELIAAGEVIERPASIIKELVENSIDAGATTIVVEIQGGGVRFIRIADNGCGIAGKDAPQAFLRHATSKVKEAVDLEHIATLGFRGEALASIAAVARVEMLTKTAEENFGTLVKISGSEIEEVSEAGCPLGTTILIRDVFYNVPARLKFLKKDVSEGNAVASIIDKIALSHPEISVRFIRDNKTIFQTPGDGKLLSAAYTIFGREFAGGLLPVDYALNGMAVQGYICRPMESRPNRLMQHFFINGRYTKTKTAAAALEEGYKGAIMVGKHPSCILQITMPCDQVDVNVHPAKIEVRFVSEKTVFDAVYFAVKSARMQLDKLQKEEPVQAIGNLLSPFLMEEEPEQISMIEEKEELPRVAEIPFPKEENPPAAEFELPRAKPRRIPSVNIDVEPNEEDFDIAPVLKNAPIYGVPQKQIVVIVPEEPQPPLPEEKPKEPVVKEKQPHIEWFGELFETYLLVRIEDEFALVDKHAAHERILYNRLLENNRRLPKQLLLTSIPVTLARQEYELVLAHLQLFDDMGFTVEDFGDRMVVLRAVPAVMGLSQPAEVFLEVASSLCNMTRAELPAMVEEILHRIACRSAVKANDKNHRDELMELVKTIYQDDRVRYCPHGRPVMIRYQKKDIEKLFGRLP